MTDQPCARLCKAITDAQPDLPDTVEVYAAVAMSTAHLTEEDVATLTQSARDPEESRVLMRPTGFMLKLGNTVPEDGEQDFDSGLGHSDTLVRIIRWAKHLGFQLIEFDGAADVIDGFPHNEW